MGCGRVLAAHLRGYRVLRETGLADFRVTALCSRRAEDAASYVRRGHGPPQRPAVSDIPGDPLAIADEYLSDFQTVDDVDIYTDYRQMIAAGKIDAVNDFSTHAMHEPIARCALEHDKHLLTQKPIARSTSAGRSLCELAESRQRVFGIFENFRFSDATRQLHWLVQSGRLGAPQLVLIGYVGRWWAPDQIVAHTPWRHRQADGGGIVLDLGPHFFNQMRLVFGEPTRILGTTRILEPVRWRRDAQGQVLEQTDCDAEDTLLAQIEFANGAVGTLFASWGGHGGESIVDDGTVYYGSKGKATRLEFTADGQPTASLPELFAEHGPEDLKQRWFPGGLLNSFALNQFDWLRAIDQQTTPEMSGREALIDLACSLAVLESAHRGRWVSPAELLAERS